MIFVCIYLSVSPSMSNTLHCLFFEGDESDPWGFKALLREQGSDTDDSNQPL